LYTYVCFYSAPLHERQLTIQIASARDLETEFAKMLPHFEGKETEHNWTPREKAVVRIRGMLQGEAHKQYPEAFLAGMKGGIFDGVSRTVNLPV
jgi:CLIP-associating protein 1/2